MVGILRLLVVVVAQDSRAKNWYVVNVDLVGVVSGDLKVREGEMANMRTFKTCALTH